MSSTQLVVKRYQGLGNLLMLLPVLIKASALGRSVTLVTRLEWIEAIAPWCIGLRCSIGEREVTHDLDRLTMDLVPRLHRTFEFANALGISGPFPLLSACKPQYQSILASRFEGATVFAPEAGHVARVWPTSRSAELAQRLLGRPLVLVGQRREPSLPCDVDLRGTLSVAQLFEVISAVRCVVSMDSGALQVAMALGVPALGIFGGVDPTYRVHAMQAARTMVSPVNCRPCNKKETCNGAFKCLSDIGVDDVCKSLETLSNVVRREIYVTSPISRDQ